MLNTLKVLYIEDDKNTRDALSYYLKKRTGKLIIAGMGTDALESGNYYSRFTPSGHEWARSNKRNKKEGCHKQNYYHKFSGRYRGYIKNCRHGYRRVYNKTNKSCGTYRKA